LKKLFAVHSFVAVIGTEHEIKNDSGNRNKNGKQQVRQRFGSAGCIINNMKARQNKYNRIADLVKKQPVHKLFFSGEGSFHGDTCLG